MPNIASLLKDEITRIARKESRRLVEPLRKQSATQRRDIAALKRECADLRRQLAALAKVAGRARPAAAEPAKEGRARRFSPGGLRSLRQRLGLSAAELGALLGVSAQSVYNWENEKARPRQAQIDAIAGLRGVGSREARARLEAVAS